MKNLFFVAILMTLISCDRNKNEWQIHGVVTDALDGQTMGGVPIKVEVKRMVSGVYNDVIETAVTGASESDGHYEITWDRDNISYLRVTAQEDQYFDAIVEISPDALNPGEYYTQNLKLTPRADVEVLLGSSDVASDVKVTFYSTDPFCTCDDEGSWRILGNQDTTIHCMSSGGKWIKYLIEASGSSGLVNHWDSLYCPPFVTTNFTYIY